MQAVLFDGTLKVIQDRPRPSPASDECLIRVDLAGICGTDLHITQGYLNFHGVLGHEMVGTVVEGPPRWKNRRVVVELNCVCRNCDMCLSGLANHCRNRTVIGIQGRDGCFAQWVCAPQANLHEVPAAITDEEAVFVEPLAAAYQAIAQCTFDARTTVSVVGPGRLGILVAQALAETGCKLTAVGRNHDKLLFCEKKGIQAIHIDELVPRNDRDVVVECSGSPEGLNIAVGLVRPRGVIILKSTCAHAGAINLAPIVVNEIKLLGSRCGPFPEAINALSRRAIDVRSMISRTFPLEQAIEAFSAAADPKNLKILLRNSP